MVDVEVEIDLDDFSDQEIRDEFRARGMSVPAPSVEVNDLFEAMRLGQKERALELLREYLMNETGRILP